MNEIIEKGKSIQDGIPTPDEPKAILNKYIDLIDIGYCCDCNELNCIDNFPQAKIAHSIRELQQENKQLKANRDEAIEYINNSWTGGYIDKTLKYKVEEINITELLSLLERGSNE